MEIVTNGVIVVQKTQNTILPQFGHILHLYPLPKYHTVLLTTPLKSFPILQHLLLQSATIKCAYSLTIDCKLTYIQITSRNNAGQTNGANNMLKFVLILTLYGTGNNPTYVLDHNLTGDDCIARITSFAHIERDIPGARLSCEFDHAQ
jgi:hypothetical protein